MTETVLETGNKVSSPTMLGRAIQTDTSRLNLLAYVHLRNIHNSTGAGRVARQLVEHLARRDDVRLEILADRSDYERIIPLVKDPWNKFHYQFIKQETSRQQARWFLLANPRAEHYWPDVDVIYCTAESYVPTKKAKLVVTLHDAAYFEDNAHRRDIAFLKTRFKWKYLYRKLECKADLFHTVSQFSADRLAHFFPDIKSRLRVIHNGISPQFFGPITPAGEAYFQGLGIAGRPFILLPGGLHYRKNAELVLQAWPMLSRRNPDLVLAIVNHSNPGYIERAKALGDNVHILGFVPDEGLRTLYSRAQIVWFPSRYEGFGMPVLEAMACGAAVVTSEASSLPEIAGNAALMASPSCAREHAELLEGLLQDDSCRIELGERGRARAARFTWDNAAEQLKGQFDSLR